jgi:hypothetical protein
MNCSISILDRQLVMAAGRLQNDADPGPPRCRRPARIRAEHVHRAGITVPEPFQDLDCRRLAGTVRSEQRKNFTGRDLEVDTIDGVSFAVGLAEVLHRDRCTVRRHALSLADR